ERLRLGGQRLLSVLRAPAEAVGDLGAQRPGDRGRRDDDRGLDRDAGGDRVAVPAACQRGRAAAAADRERSRSGIGRAGGAVRPRAGTGWPALKLVAGLTCARAASITSI